MPTNKIVEMPAWELSQQIHEKKVSCVEVMQAYLDQIEAVNHHVNAIVTLQDKEDLLAQAKQRDEELAAGKDMGWMHGFPQAIKDLAMTKGILTTYGSPIHKNFVPEVDDVIVARMKEAGSIIVGKTNTPEWGYGSQTYNEVFGATGNPYDASKTCGGSSGGAACSLAMRMQPVADGGDYMGSLRNPAGWCNVYGYRPSWGRVPSGSAEAYLNSCATLGPMARTVADLALLLATQSGYEPTMPWTLADDEKLKALTPYNVHEKLKTDVSGRKIAWLGDWNGYLAMEDGVLAQCEKTLKSFANMGVTVEAIENPTDPEALWNEVWKPFRHFSTSNLKAFYDDPEKQSLLKPEAIWEYEGTLNMTAQDLHNAGVKRSQWLKDFLKVYEKYDYIAVPTAQVFPFDKTVHWPKEVAGRQMDCYNRWMEVVTPWTMVGAPVAAVPAGFNEQGLSIGIQIIGKPRSDYDLLQFAYAYEQENDFVTKYRPKFLD